jgi:lysozyme
MKNPAPLFAAIRTIAGPLSQRDVDLINLAIAQSQDDKPESVPAAGRDVSPAGIAAMQRHEGCALSAYPDPGSRDGTPWTIGYGATGPDIAKGVKWTQAQADERFVNDVRRFENEVERLLAGTPTAQHQFDAMVSFAYNVGVSAFAKSTLLREHRAGHYNAAAAQFGRWVNNDGKRMAGLVNRRRDEAAMYAGGTA